MGKKRKLNESAKEQFFFVGIESGTGKNINNVLVIMQKRMVPDGKDWIRNNYGTTCLSVNDIECKSSVMLHKQHMPEKVQNVEEHLNETISNQKKK